MTFPTDHHHQISGFYPQNPLDTWRVSYEPELTWRPYFQSEHSFCEPHQEQTAILKAEVSPPNVARTCVMQTLALDGVEWTEFQRSEVRLDSGQIQPDFRIPFRTDGRKHRVKFKLYRSLPWAPNSVSICFGQIGQFNIRSMSIQFDIFS